MTHGTLAVFIVLVLAGLAFLQLARGEGEAALLWGFFWGEVYGFWFGARSC